MPGGLWQVIYGVMKKFEELTEREVLALAIALEEEDERVYSDFAEGLRQDYPATASMFDGMREEESGHRRRLLELFQKKFGEHIPLIRRQDVRGFVERPALWLVRPLRIEAVRKEASTMEVETRRFYEKASARTQDASIRQLLDDLATEEREHEERAQELDKQKLPDHVKADEEVAQRRLFVLQIVQPGLAGLMDGSVSTLAPVFAAAFATQKSWDAFLVGLAASAGAGISMGFAEALSDDGSLTGRGTSLGARVDLWSDDGRGRNRSYAAVSLEGLQDGAVGGRNRCPGGTRGDHLGPQTLHGYAMDLGRLAGRAGRRTGVHHRHADWEIRRVSRAQPGDRAKPSDSVA